MSSVNCLNCGAPISYSTTSKYIKCEYCKSLNSNFSSLDKIDELIKDTDFQNDYIKEIQINHQLKDYSALKNVCEKILLESPNSWVALTYNAVSCFWLGYDDFIHLETVKRYLLKAKILSNNNELVVDTTNKIANDIILLGCKNSCKGDEFKKAIQAFNVSLEISQLDDETKNTLNKYLQSAFDYQKEKLSDLLQKNKVDYDPPYVSIQNLFEICRLSNVKEHYEFYYLHLKIHLSKNKTKSYYTELFNTFQNIEKYLYEQKSDVVGKNITFNLFGKITVK